MYMPSYEDLNSVKLYCSTPSRRTSDFGLKLYKDKEVTGLHAVDTVGHWNILLFKSGLYSSDYGFKKSGLYICPVFDLSQGIEVGAVFSGYLLSVPLLSWKMFDIYNLSQIIESRSFDPFIELPQSSMSSLCLMMDLLDNALKSSKNPSNAMELTYVCRSIMMMIYRHCKTTDPVEHTVSGNKLADRFLQLAEKKCLEERKLEYYAKELDVSMKYLSHLISSSTGKKANTWISEFVMEKVRIYLISTSYSIQEISDMAGFRNVSDFCRFFRRHAGMSPLKYRKKERMVSPAVDAI